MAIAISQLDPLDHLNGSEIVEVSQLSGIVTMTATTISVDSGAVTMNDANLGFVAAGFASGDRVLIGGFLNSSNNLFSTHLITVAPGVITPSLPVGEVLVTEAAGRSITITKWTSKRSYLSGENSALTQLLLPSAFYPGVPEDSGVILYIPIITNTIFPANFTGSVSKALVAATATTVITIQKNGSSVGSITFAAAGTTGVFASSGGASVSFAAGDMLSFVNQATADATLASIGTSLYGVR